MTASDDINAHTIAALLEQIGELTVENTILNIRLAQAEAGRSQ